MEQGLRLLRFLGPHWPHPCLSACIQKLAFGITGPWATAVTPGCLRHCSAGHCIALGAGETHGTLNGLCWVTASQGHWVSRQLVQTWLYIFQNFSACTKQFSLSGSELEVEAHGEISIVIARTRMKNFISFPVFLSALFLTSLHLPVIHPPAIY